MSTRAAFFAFVIALLVTTAPSFGQDVQSRPDVATPATPATPAAPDVATPSRPDDATPCAGSACTPDVQPPDSALGDSHRMLAAQVVRIDEQAGHVLLNTALGIVTVPASPAVISQLNVGDLVVLRVVPDSDEDSPSASPPEDSTPDRAPDRAPGTARDLQL